MHICQLTAERLCEGESCYIDYEKLNVKFQLKLQANKTCLTFKPICKLHYTVINK